MPKTKSFKQPNFGTISASEYRAMEDQLRCAQSLLSENMSQLRRMQRRINVLDQENKLLERAAQRKRLTKRPSYSSDTSDTSDEETVPAYHSQRSSNQHPRHPPKSHRSLPPPPPPVPVKASGKRSRRDPTQIRRVQPIDRDEEGNYVLPVTVGILTVLDLGTVVYDRHSFHNDRYIWPVGFKVTRYYNSTVDASSQTCYTATITDGGDGPRFVIEAEDRQNDPIVGNTATGAWTTVVKLANEIRNRSHSNSASGPDYFGFSHPTIAKMIQDLPNAKRCRNYRWQQFEVMSARSVPQRKYPVPPIVNELAGDLSKRTSDKGSPLVDRSSLVASSPAGRKYEYSHPESPSRSNSNSPSQSIEHYQRDGDHHNHLPPSPSHHHSHHYNDSSPLPPPPAYSSSNESN